MVEFFFFFFYIFAVTIGHIDTSTTLIQFYCVVHKSSINAVGLVLTVSKKHTHTQNNDLLRPLVLVFLAILINVKTSTVNLWVPRKLLFVVKLF